MDVSCWLQHADFDTDEHGLVDVRRALELLSAHPWRRDLNLARQLEAAGKDWCPPGLGFTRSSGHILHLCAQESGRWMVHFNYPEQTRILGLFSRERQRVRTNLEIPSGQLENLIRAFFREDYHQLREL